MQPQRAMALTRAHFRQAHWLQRQAPISTTMGHYAALSTTSHAKVRLQEVAIRAPVIQQWGWRLWTCAQVAIKTASISHSKHLPRSQTLMPVVWPLAPKSTYFLLFYPCLKRTIICIRDSRSWRVSVIWIWMVKALSRLSLRPSVNSTLMAQSWSIYQLLTLIMFSQTHSSMGDLMSCLQGIRHRGGAGSCCRDCPSRLTSGQDQQ
jgi:hypothetical protein